MPFCIVEFFILLLLLLWLLLFCCAFSYNILVINTENIKTIIRDVSCLCFDHIDLFES